MSDSRRRDLHNIISKSEFDIKELPSGDNIMSHPFNNNVFDADVNQKTKSKVVDITMECPFTLSTEITPFTTPLTTIVPTSLAQHKTDEIPGNKIFVGGLSWDTTQSKLYDYFSKFGPIVDCILMLDGATGRSRGFGFVTFLQRDSVNSVLSAKQQHILDNKIIDPKEAVPKHIKDGENGSHLQHQSNKHSTVNKTRNGNNYINSTLSKPNSKHQHYVDQQPNHNSQCCQYHSTTSSSYFLCPNIVDDTKIFVGGIGHASEDDLLDYFSVFGNVTDITIMMDKITGRRRGFAFIGFSNVDSAEHTSSMRYHSICNKQIEVKKALPKDTKYLTNTFTVYNNNASEILPPYNHGIHDPTILFQPSLHAENIRPNKIDGRQFTHNYIGDLSAKICSTYDDVLNSYPVVGANERTTNTLQSPAYGGEWDFDDAIQFHHNKPNIVTTTASQNTLNAIKNITDPTQNTFNNGFHSISNPNVRQDNFVGDTIDKNKKNCFFTHDMFESNPIFQTNRPSVQRAAKLGSVNDTTNLLSRQIPDDTKDSIVELLNEIWKST